VFVSLPAVCGNLVGVPTEIERLYREHRAGLVRLVQRELHDRHEAEDVVQTAFLDAQRALEHGTIPRNPPAWLAAIALNAGRRLRRRHQNAEPLEDYAVQEAAAIPEIRAALAGLPREQRTAVVYRDVLGLSYVETAEQMGLTVNAVTMLLHRGRRRLRETLGGTAPGIGLWHWLKQAGAPQVAVAKGAAAVIAAGCLATTGAVVARMAAPIGSDAAAAAATRAAGPASPAEEAGRAAGGALAADSTPHRFARASGSSAGAIAAVAGGTIRTAPTSAQGSTSGATAGSVPASAPVPSTTEGAPSLLPSTLSPPAVSVPTLSVPTVAATVTVSTPVATVTVATPTIPTVTTPIATVTVPIP
jgi:RNA polymerase sigma-70 factor (ECF subfamily)